MSKFNYKKEKSNITYAYGRNQTNKLSNISTAIDKTKQEHFIVSRCKQKKQKNPIKMYKAGKEKKKRSLVERNILKTVKGTNHLI